MSSPTIPKDNFWDSFEYATSRNFLECFSKQEIQQISFPCEHNRTEKLKFLLGLLQAKASAEKANALPLPFHENDYLAWKKLTLGLATLHGELGNLEEQVKLMEEMVQRNKDHSNLSSMHYLSSLKEKQGKYAETETLAKRVLPWLDNHPLLGSDSPQSLGSRRLLMIALWKQGKEEEAKNLCREILDLIGGMGDDKFANLQGEERELMNKTICDLEIWEEQTRKAEAKPDDDRGCSTKC